MEILVTTNGEFDLDIARIKKTGKFGDPSLNSNGVKQAKILAEYLKLENIGLIFNSPAKCAVTTAMILSERLGTGHKDILGLAPVVYPKENNLLQLIQKLENDPKYAWQLEWHEKGCGFEDANLYFARFRKATTYIKENFADEKALIIGHKETVWFMHVLTNNTSVFEALSLKVPPCTVTRFYL